MTTTRKFLDDVLPPTGKYSTAHITSNGKWSPADNLETIDDVIAIARKYYKQRVDAYFGVASFAGKRSADNVQYKKAWYVDIDCKQGGQYPDKKSGMAAIVSAIKSGLPKPSYIVDSGYGYHLYWVATKPVPRAMWEAVAGLIDQVTKAANLNVDGAVTTDSARVLRIPGTMNFKNPANPVQCTILRDFQTTYSPDRLFADLTDLIPDNSAADINDDLALPTGSVNREPPPAAAMLEKCPLMKHNMDTHGAYTPEPVWHKILQVLTFTSDGRNYIHPISDGHPGYSHNRTEKKFDWIDRQRQAKPEMGAATCKTIANTGGEQCKTCPMRDEGHSPIWFSFQQAHDPELPYPFRNGQQGVEVYDATEDAWVQMLPTTVKNLSASRIVGEGTYVSMMYGRAKLEIDIGMFADHKATYQFFSKYRTGLGRHGAGTMEELVNSFVEQLERQGGVKEAVSHFGWVEDAFHYDGEMYGSSKASHIVKVDKNLAEQYSPRGNLAEWQACANHILAQKREASWTVIASAFAAPLMTFTGLSGTILSIVSPGSGTGKTTALKVAQAVWGDPRTGIAHLNDTDNAVLNRLGVLANLPSYWDEVRGNPQEMDQFIKMIFRVAQGKEKARLTSSIQQRKTGTWSTMMTIGSNESIMEHVVQTIGNSDAGAARVLELTARNFKDNSMSDGKARTFFAKVHHNYGHAGATYAQYIGEHKHAVAKLVQGLDDQLSRELKSTGDERFWIASLATLLAGAVLATRLNICQFDVPELKKYLVRHFKEQRKAKKTDYIKAPGDKAMGLLEEFLNQHPEQIVHCDVQGSRTGNVKSQVLLEPSRYPVIGRIARDTGVVRVDQVAFKQWVYRTNGGWSDEAVKHLARRPGSSRLKSDLATGCPRGTHKRSTCLEVQLDNYTYTPDNNPNNDLGA